MRIFLTGANGFIGGSVASALVAAGHTVRGLVRDEAKADAVRAHRITPVIGSLDDATLLQLEARAADAVVNAASSDHEGAVLALLGGLAGSGKPFLHTSGSSVVSDRAMGEPTDRILGEGDPYTPEPEKAARFALDRRIRETSGVRSVVLCNTMIYGTGLGASAESVQIPLLARQARASGVVRTIGRGLNRWSNAHIADVAALYVLALEKAPGRSLFYVENGEESFLAIARAIADRLELGPPESWSSEEAAFAAWGRETSIFALGSNSRVRGMGARAIGWAPKHASVTDWIRRELPRS